MTASCLALIGLVLFQVQWMLQSRDLLEEQFNNRVNMALCNAVEEVAQTGICEQVRQSCSLKEGDQISCQQHLDTLLNAEDLNVALGKSLDFYNIKMDYEVRILDKDSMDEEQSSHCCSLSPIADTDTHLLNIHFPGKVQYILDKLGFMLATSILILIFISAVFILANYYLLRQKRIAEQNVDFFNHMAHEFRTPLTNISLATRLLMKNRKDLKDDRVVEVLERESKKMMEQVDRVLALAQLESGEYKVKKENISITDLLKKVVNGMDLQIKEKNGQVNLQFPNHIASIQADPFHLGNAFRNLIDNSLKYSERQPEIEISLQEDDPEKIAVSFSDNGVGICKTEQTMVFDKFQRLKLGPDTCKGFGLGLSYVKKIIDLHDGHIQIFSSPNKGTRFDLTLPIR